eukprot:8914155-Pyramimonas_sp.AAC.1
MLRPRTQIGGEGAPPPPPPPLPPRMQGCMPPAPRARQTETSAPKEKSGAKCMHPARMFSRCFLDVF